MALVLLSGCSVTDGPADASITENGATWPGRVIPTARPSTWWFEYGTTTGYGAETAPRRSTVGGLTR